MAARTIGFTTTTTTTILLKYNSLVAARVSLSSAESTLRRWMALAGTTRPKSRIEPRKRVESLKFRIEDEGERSEQEIPRVSFQFYALPV